MMFCGINIIMSRLTDMFKSAEYARSTAASVINDTVRSFTDPSLGEWSHFTPQVSGSGLEMSRVFIISVAA